MVQRQRADGGRTSILKTLRDWILDTPRLVSICALIATALGGIHLLFRSLPVYWSDPIGPAEYGEEMLAVFRHVMKSVYFWMWLLVPVLMLSIIRARKHGPPFATAAIGSAIVFVVWGATEIASHGVSNLEMAGVEPSPLSTIFRLSLTGALILSPPFVVWAYARTPILSRYLLRQFLSPFLYCFLGFLAIWLVIDLSDNGPDFFEAENASIRGIVRVYVVQAPQVIVMILPITLLLSLLYSLGKLSKSNEIISMLTAGKSLPKVLLPLFAVGLYCSLITLALNYEWAPEAEARRSAAKEAMEDDEQEAAAKKEFSVRAKHYRNREDRRSWFVGRIPFDLATEKLRNVEIFQQDATGKTQFAYFASKASWYYGTREWRLIKGKRIDYADGEDIHRQYDFAEEVIRDWRETPWKIYSESLDPDQMGVPGLSFHIKTNADQPPKLLAPFRTHWHYRWALPWSCLVITLVAAPLGIVFSRRGALGGVAAAMLIFFGMLVSTNFFLALGQGKHIPAFVGAWSTNIVLAMLGLLLLYIRSGNRELPKLSLAGLKNWVTGSGSRGQSPAASRA